MSYNIPYLNTIGIKAECLWARAKIISNKIRLKLLTVYNYNKNSKKIQYVRNILTPGFKT